MSLGPGKYDPLCTYVREVAEARGAIVIVIDGNEGGGFSVQGDLATQHALPEILEYIARVIRRDNGEPGGSLS